MKQITILILGFFISTLATKAQNATDLLNEVDTKVKSYKNIVIDFKYSLSNKKANVQQETRGNVHLEGEKYLLNLMGSTHLFDGRKLHVINDEDEEISISNLNNDTDFTPSKMLSFYKKGYSSELDIIQNVKGRKIQYVKLIPTEPNEEVKSILLGIDKITKHIYKLIITQHNTTEVTITVNKFKTNQPLSDTLFTFEASKYEGYYINHLD